MSIFDGEKPNHTPLNLFLIQLVIVVVFSKILSYLLKYLKQPSVIAEILTGIILGPSVLGHIPNYTHEIFPPKSLEVFGVFANFGLILFMFIIGLEIDTKLMKHNVGTAISISVTAMLAPFALGLLSSWVIHEKEAHDVSFASFLLFVGVALSITAFPVLARILSETKLLDSRVGSVALSSAAVDDVVAWCLLAIVVAYARATNGIHALWTFLTLIGFIIVMFGIVRPILLAIAKSRGSHGEAALSYNFVVAILILVFVCAWFTEVIGVHAIFGGFILGIVIPRHHNWSHKLIERIEDVVVVLLLPLYFTYSGLRTDIGSLNDPITWGLTLLVITTACAGKILGATIAARINKTSWRESWTIGILMNTKGLVELIVLNVGLDVGVLNTRVFTIFVVMALVTTFMTTPLLWFVYLRHQNQFQKEAKEDSFKALITVQNPQLATWLAKVVGCLYLHAKQKLSIKTLFLQEISDRPSSYFKSELYSMWQGAPLVKSTNKKMISSVKQKPSMAHVDVTSKILASANLGEDVKVYASRNAYNLLIVNIYHKVESDALKPSASATMSPGESRNRIPFTPRQSVSVMVTKQIKNISNLVQNGDMIDYLIHNVECSFGILVRKQELHEEEPHKILFVYCGNEWESSVLEVAERLIHNSAESNIKKITVVTTPEESELFHVKPTIELEEGTSIESKLEVVEVENPNEYAEQATGFDLIIMGDDRYSQVALKSGVVQFSPKPVLILYNPTSVAKKQSSFELEGIIVQKGGKAKRGGDDVESPRESEEPTKV